MTRPSGSTSTDRQSNVTSRRPSTIDRQSTGSTTMRPNTGSSVDRRSTTRQSAVDRQSAVTARPATGTTTDRPGSVTARPGTYNNGQVTTPRPGNGGSGDNGTTGNLRGKRPNVGTGTTHAGNLDNSGRLPGGDNGNGGNGRPDGKGNNNGGVGNDRGGHGNNHGGMGNDRGGRGNDRGGYGNDRGGRGNDRRPPRANPHNNPYREHYSHNFSHGNWHSRPLPPPARPYRPAPLRYYRPVIPAHYRPYVGAPVIDRILGLTFGSLFDVSLNYLYSNGYYIDGYTADVVYLRDVRMLNLMWPDVMLSYDSYGGLANAQFVFSTGYADRSRYNRLYHDLCAVYGPPISVDSYGATWFGGNTTGYVTLTADFNGARFYTTLSVGY